MKAFALSNRRGSGPSIAPAACLSMLLSFGCAGSGSGGSTTGAGGHGGTTGSGTGGSATGGSGSGGSGTGGSGSGGATGGSTGGSGAGGNVGAGGSISSGAAGNSGAAGSGGHGTGGGGGAGGAAGSGGSTGTGGAGGRLGIGGGVGGAGTVASHCAARPGMVFCDDFEADAPGAPPSPWTTMDGAAADVTIDGTNPASSGTKSVHVSSDGYDTFLALHDPSVLPVTGGRLYLRFYIRLAAPMTQDHNTFVRGDLYAAPGTGNNLLFGEDNYMIYESIIGDAQVAMSNNAYYSDGKMIGVNYPAGVWTCVELLLDHNAPAIDVWVNGTEVPDLHQTAWKIDAYDYLRFGFEQYAGPASEIWYDDIAIGTQPIGCN